MDVTQYNHGRTFIMYNLALDESLSVTWRRIVARVNDGIIAKQMHVRILGLLQGNQASTVAAQSSVHRETNWVNLDINLCSNFYMWYNCVKLCNITTKIYTEKNVLQNKYFVFNVMILIINVTKHYRHEDRNLWI